MARSATDSEGAGIGRRVYVQLRTQIADGTLKSGAKMPPTRSLAKDLGVSRTTVTTAYEQLASEGFIVTSQGRAARVAAGLIEPKRSKSRTTTRIGQLPRLSSFGRRVDAMPPSAISSIDSAPIDFLYGAVASRDFPTHAWRKAYLSELLRQQQRLYYIPPEGEISLRQVLQGYLRRARGLVCEAQQIVMVHGSQQAIDMCARLLLDARDTFVFENPGYLIARRCFEATGAKCASVDVDSNGLDTTQLPQDGDVRLAYVTPSHQFPLGGVLPVGRRRELLQWAKRFDAWVIEDDYDGEFRYGQRPIDALQSMDTDGRVIYIGTFSKSLSPQLRLGYMVLPNDLVPVFQRSKQLLDRHEAVLEQRVLAKLIESGAYESHVRRISRQNERRRKALLNAVARHLPKEVEVTGTAAGLHLVLQLPFLQPRDESNLVTAATASGVKVYPLAPLFSNSTTANIPRYAGLILGYASLTIDQIEQGICALAKAIARCSPQAVGP